MPLRIYNTFSKQVEEFTPLDPSGRRVTFYSCGPTVYDYAHIGNFRSFLNADLLRRTLELLGHEVRHVMNMTDVGHMTEDDAADGGGEDRMQVAGRRLLEAKKAGKLPPHARDIDPGDPYAIADFYIEAFQRDARRLGLLVAIEAQDHPELMPRPTRYLPQMIALVQKLIAGKHAYVASDGVVYFDVRSYPDYGRLSGNTPDSIREAAGGRVRAETQAVKRHPADFMLFKRDPSHIMRWESPWGEGYPGWHLECSAMAMDLLARGTKGVIDLHSGGEDNICPHHECEIAQSCAASGQRHFARSWFHTRLLMVDGGKMAKSKKNFYTLEDLLGRGASPAAVRLELTKTHYRSNANFTLQGLKDSQARIDAWTGLERRLAAAGPGRGAGTPLQVALPRFTAALSSDLNVSEAIAALDMAAGRSTGAGGAAELAALRTMLRALGVLDLEREAVHSEPIANLVQEKVDARNAARARKDWETSDQIRDELASMGIAIKDGPAGTTWTRVVR